MKYLTKEEILRLQACIVSGKINQQYDKLTLIDIIDSYGENQEIRKTCRCQVLSDIDFNQVLNQLKEKAEKFDQLNENLRNLLQLKYAEYVNNPEHTNEWKLLKEFSKILV